MLSAVWCCPLSLHMSSIAVFVTENFNMALDNSTTFVWYNIECCITLSCIVLSVALTMTLNTVHNNMTQQVMRWMTMQHDTRQCNALQWNSTLNIYRDNSWYRCDKRQCNNMTFLCLLSGVVSHCHTSCHIVMCHIKYQVVLPCIVSYVVRVLSVMVKSQHDTQFGTNRIPYLILDKYSHLSWVLKV